MMNELIFAYFHFLDLHIGIEVRKPDKIKARRIPNTHGAMNLPNSINRVLDIEIP